MGMKISSVKAQKKDASAYSVFIDDAYAFSLSASELLNQGLVEGQDIDQSQLQHLKSVASCDKAYRRAISMLARRARSKQELQQYLTRKGHKAAEVDKVLNSLEEKGYINDKAFSEAWVQSRLLLKNVSIQRLRQELRQKGVANDVINAAIESSEHSEQEALAQLIQKKRTISRYQNKEKLTQYLLRQGFRYDDIKQALLSS